MTIGHCKHGEFLLEKGCQECIEEHRLVIKSEPTNIVKVRYFGQNDELSAREYTYFTAEPLNIGDIVEVSVRDAIGQAKVTAINVAESEIELFKDKVKTIPAHSVSIYTTWDIESSDHPMEPKVEVESSPGTDMEILNWHTQALSLKEYAEKRVIKSVEDMKYATDDLSIIAHLKKAMEERRKQYVKPLQEQVKSINDTYKTLMEPVEAADRITRDKILGYQRQQERLRREQEEINRLREEAAQRQKELTGEIVEIEKVEVVVEAPKRVSTEMGVTGTRDNWKWEVLDINLVAREYLMINVGMLTPIVKASKGRITIPGIRIYNEPILAVNTR